MIKNINTSRNGPLTDIAVERPFSEIQSEIQDLKDTLEDHSKADGIAMNQIWDKDSNLMPRVFLAKIPTVNGEITEVFINPRGMGTGGQVKGWESCLSFPGRLPILKNF